jgi:dUTP pyrophosphatase
MMIDIKIEKLHKEAEIPIYSYHDDACCDLFVVEDYTVRVGQRILARTGIAIEIPTGYEVQIRSRSGLVLKQGLIILNAPGTIDCQYRNEIKLILMNVGDKLITLRKGDRVAQACVKPVYKINFIEVDELNESNRNLNGFGSTGTNRRNING